MRQDRWRVLVVGSGAREHALAWKIARSDWLGALFVAPGNPGSARYGERVALDPLDGDVVACWARANRIDLAVVGPEDPLVAGLADRLIAAGVPTFGPSAAAAVIEGSKVWAKAFMRRHGIPGAADATFDDPAAARAWLRAHPGPVVVKADGPATGKGVVVAADTSEAEAAVEAMLVERRFGRSGERILIEERLTGREVSAFALVDGETALPFGLACDYKRVGEGDTGPNTGGMGGFSPPPFVDERLAGEIHERILLAAARGLAAEGRPFRGFLFAGLMLTADGPKVLEFNCRLGDPEAELLLPRLDEDLLPRLMGAARGELPTAPLRWRSGATVAVVLASRGYPGDYPRGLPIEGLAAAERAPGALVFQAGTVERDGRLVTAGGRVLCVVGHGDDIAAARAVAYRAAEAIHFDGRHYRRDIAEAPLA